jgi:molybdopterin/thiamine biosynthesis adenylyltransferase
VARPTFEEIRLPSDSRADAHTPRRARFPQFVALPAGADRRLDGLRIAIVGAGSVGRSLVVHASRLMVSVLWIVDPGRFKPTSFLTYPHLLPGEELDESKAVSAGRLAKRISPQTRVWVFDGGVEALPETAFADADFVLLATDQLSAEVETGQRCAHLGTKLIHASVHGPTLVAQVRCLSNRHREGPRPCLACGYTRQERASLDQQIRFSCEGAQTGRTVAESRTAPTMSVSFLCAAAADLAMMQLIKWALALGPAPDDTLLEYAGYTNRSTISPLVRDPNCPCDHAVFEPANSPRPMLEECSLSELIEAAGFNGAAGETLLTVGDDLAFAESAQCACGRSVRVGRFVSTAAGPTEPIERCACGGAFQVHRFYAHRPAPASVVEAVRDRPLRELGAASVDWVLVRQGDRPVLFRSGWEGRKST